MQGSQVHTLCAYYEISYAGSHAHESYARDVYEGSNLHEKKHIENEVRVLGDLSDLMALT